ncbi:unnamed protein product [Mycobacterium sp. PO2]|nr:unnamed protein product [Mycobacterium sp. PO2]
MATDAKTGMSSSNAHQGGPANTIDNIANASINTAMCAIGEILMTTGVDSGAEPDAEGVSMAPSSHRGGPPRHAGRI